MKNRVILNDFLQCISNNIFLEILEAEKSTSIWNGDLEDLLKSDIYERIKERTVAKKSTEICSAAVDNFLPADYKNIEYILNGINAHEATLSYLFIELN